MALNISSPANAAASAPPTLLILPNLDSPDTRDADLAVDAGDGLPADAVLDAAEPGAAPALLA